MRLRDVNDSHGGSSYTFPIALFAMHGRSLGQVTLREAVWTHKHRQQLAEGAGHVNLEVGMEM